MGLTFLLSRVKHLDWLARSGSGKSTVARTILQLVEAKEGSIQVGGTEVTQMDQGALKRYRKQVQVVFQDPYSSLNPSHIVGEIVGELVTQHRGIPRGHKRDEVVGDLLEKVGLGQHFMERFPYELSGGQRQRVAIARALSVEPEMIYL